MSMLRISAPFANVIDWSRKRCGGLGAEIAVIDGPPSRQNAPSLGARSRCYPNAWACRYRIGSSLIGNAEPFRGTRNMSAERNVETGTNQLLCSIRDGVATLTLNRPEARN